MPHRYSPYRRWLVILLLALLAPVMPGRMNICLLPDGEMHLEAECSTPCSQATTLEEKADGLSQADDDRGGCLDFKVGENAARRQIHNGSQAPTPGLLLQPQPVGLFPAGQFRFFAKPPAPSPHLKSHQTTVLRI